MNMKVIGTLAVAALIGTTAACGSSDSDSGSSADAESVYAKYAQMTPDQRDSELAQLAKDEGGKLTVYTDYSNEAPIAKAFGDKYGIDVTVYAPDNETLIQKLEQEESAGHHSADVLDSTYPFVTEAADKSLLYPGWKPAAKYGEVTSDSWYPTRFVAWATSWNTDAVKDSDLPDTIDGLADPKWKGKIAMEVGDYDWYAGILQYLQDDRGMSEDQAEQTMQQIADNSVPMKGHTAIAQAIISKQVLVSPTTYIQNVIEQQPAPIAWQSDSGKYVAPVVLGPAGIGLLDHAPHPAAAMLYADFILSQEGQQALEDAGSTPGDLKLAGLDDETTVYPPVKDLLSSTKYQDAYQQLLGQ